jgi:hypothetical protein
MKSFFGFSKAANCLKRTSITERMFARLTSVCGKRSSLKRYRA